MKMLGCATIGTGRLRSLPLIGLVLVLGLLAPDALAGKKPASFSAGMAAGGGPDDGVGSLPSVYGGGGFLGLDPTAMTGFLGAGGVVLYGPTPHVDRLQRGLQATPGIQVERRRSAGIDLLLVRGEGSFHVDPRVLGRHGVSVALWSGSRFRGAVGAVRHGGSWGAPVLLGAATAIPLDALESSDALIGKTMTLALGSADGARAASLDIQRGPAGPILSLHGF